MNTTDYSATKPVQYTPRRQRVHQAVTAMLDIIGQLRADGIGLDAMPDELIQARLELKLLDSRLEMWRQQDIEDRAN